MAAAPREDAAARYAAAYAERFGRAPDVTPPEYPEQSTTTNGATPHAEDAALLERDADLADALERARIAARWRDLADATRERDRAHGVGRRRDSRH